MKISFAVGSFVAMPPQVPGEDPQLVEILRRSVAGLIQQQQVLGNVFAAIANGVENKIGDDALALGVLRYFQRQININHAGQHPTVALQPVAHQKPIVISRRGSGIWLGR